MKKHVILLLAIALPAVPACAQFFKVVDKTVTVRIPHPPTVGLMVKRVAFSPPTGNCADDLVNGQLVPDFERNRIEVVDRQHLNQILAEQNFSQTQQGELALGRVLGPSVMVFLKVDDCQASQDRLIDNSQRTLNGQVITTYIAKTRFLVHGNIQIADLVSGKILGSEPFTAHPDKQNTDTSGYPEFPPSDEVKETAIQEAAQQIHRIFFPWTEAARLFVHDDKECGLKQVSDLIHGGDAAAAAQLAQSNLTQCKTQKNEKVLARAYYDTGLALMISGNYLEAAPLFSQAMQMKGADQAALALQTCNRAESGSAAVKKYEAAWKALPDPAPISLAAAAPPATPAPQTQAPAQNATQNAPAAKPTSDIESRLKQLDQLLKRGLITQKDYDAKKAKILSEL